MRARDTDPDPGEYTPTERRYYLTDANYNVVMLVTDAARGAERVFYKAYGEPECYPFGDVDGDYDVDSADSSEITNIKDGYSPYNILGDIDLDGDVDATDVTLHGYIVTKSPSGGANVLSTDDVGNDVGYAAYLWNDERAQWHVRARGYSPRLGRWLQRDPVLYRGGSFNLFQYVLSTPTVSVDPTGLDSGKEHWDEDIERMKETIRQAEEARKRYQKWREWNESDACPEGTRALWVCRGKLGGDDPKKGRTPWQLVSHSYVACANPFTTPNELIPKFGKHPREEDIEPLRQTPDDPPIHIPQFRLPTFWPGIRHLPFPFPFFGPIIVPVRGPDFYTPPIYKSNPFRGPGHINTDDGRDVAFATCYKRCVDPECYSKKCSAPVGPTQPGGTPYWMFDMNCHQWADECGDLSGLARGID